MQHDFSDLEPFLLGIGDKDAFAAHFLSFLDLGEVVNDNSHKEIDDELAADDHVSDKVNDHYGLVVLLWLLVDSGRVDSVIHYSHPALGGHHLEQHGERVDHVVEIHLSILPLAIVVQTVLLCEDMLVYEVLVKALATIELAFEQVYSHDSVNQQDQSSNSEDISHERY